MTACQLFYVKIKNVVGKFYQLKHENYEKTLGRITMSKSQELELAKIIEELEMKDIYYLEGYIDAKRDEN